MIDLKHISKFRTALLLALLMVVAVAFFDIKSAQSGVFGSFESYTTGNYTSGWWGLFYLGVMFVFAIIPLSYYFFYKKDKTDAIAIFLTSYVMWMFGLADALYFWLQAVKIPSELPWLVNNTAIMKVSSLLGLSTVTNLSLIVSILIGGLIVFFSTKYLHKIN